MGKIHKSRSKLDYILAAERSISIAGMCRELGLLPKGGNYGTMKRYIKIYDIDISHFLGQGWSKDSFSENPVSNEAVKLKIIRERGHQCEKCKLIEWFNIPITLELEHIDGNNTNNSYSNLELLCPNCHSQTPTWKRSKASLMPKEKSLCPSCGKDKLRKSKSCNRCAPSERLKANKNNQATCLCGKKITSHVTQCNLCAGEKYEKIIWPDTSDLINSLQETNYSQVAKQLGVSDNAIRKRLKNRGIDPKTFTIFNNSETEII